MHGIVMTSFPRYITGSETRLPVTHTFKLFVNLITQASKFIDHNESFEAFAAVMFQIEVFWHMTPCSVVVGYQLFREPS